MLLKSMEKKVEDQEIWLPVKNYEYFYQVSNLGRVKRIFFKLYKDKEKILKQIPVHGYPRLMLAIKGVRVNAVVHRLVAEAFIPNIENKPQVNHIDGNKLNNKASNLEWCTGSENTIHYYKKLKKIK